MIKVTIFNPHQIASFVIDKKEIKEYVEKYATKSVYKTIEVDSVEYIEEEFTDDSKLVDDPSGAKESVEVTRQYPGDDNFKILQQFHPDAKKDGDNVKFTVISPKKIPKASNQLVPKAVKKEVERRVQEFDGELIVEVTDIDSGKTEFKKASEIVK